MTRSAHVALVVVGCFGGLSEAAQQGPAFEEVSIKESREAGFSAAKSDAGFVSFRGAALKGLILRAFHIALYQCEGPSWLDTASYDVSAKLPDGSSPAQIPAMLENMLVERFALKSHWETIAKQGYVLLIGKNGPKLKKSEVPQDTRTRFSVSPAGYVGLTHATLPEFARALTMYLGQPVTDMTNLAGNFDISLDFDPSSLSGFAAMLPSEGGAPSESDLKKPSIFTAIEGLGLKLESRKVSFKRLVVDHIERVPTIN